MPPQRLTNEMIAAAIEGFEAQKKRIDGQIAELRSLLTSDPAETAEVKAAAPRKRGKFSAATRLKMKESQQRRWARIKLESTSSMVLDKPRRRLSAAGRQAIAEAARKRWAAKKTPGPNATKKVTRKKAAAKKVSAKV